MHSVIMHHLCYAFTDERTLVTHSPIFRCLPSCSGGAEPVLVAPTRNKETAAINARAFPSIPGGGPKGSRILAERWRLSFRRPQQIGFLTPVNRVMPSSCRSEGGSLRGNHRAQHQNFAILAFLALVGSKGYCGHARSTPRPGCAHLSRLPVRDPASGWGGTGGRHPGLRTVVARRLGPA